MNLYQYLRRFRSIAWYPSACVDGMAMACLSFNSLFHLGIPKEEQPDCFVYTDYCSYSEYRPNQRFALDLEEGENETVFCDIEGLKVTAYNVKELPRIKLGLNLDFVHFGYDYRYYGRVFIADMLIEHATLGRSIAKIVYVFAENTQFAFDVLLKHNIRVSYPIHSRYGHGFGGGNSSGAYMFHVLKNLGAKYFASDMDELYDNDVADSYLTDDQKKEIPILREICDFARLYGWYGYDETKLFRIDGFTQKQTLERAPRFVLRRGFEHEGTAL